MSATTQIKRLYQGSQEFVPITLSEAVVVNGTNISELNNTITTLDKVLRYVISKGTGNADAIQTVGDSLANAVRDINAALAKKQDTLTPGNGISITKDLETGNLVISTNLSFELYTVVKELPAIVEANTNTIYLVPNTSTSNQLEKDVLDEYIKVKNPNTADVQNPFIWERLGHITAGTDISGLLTKVQTLEADVATLKGQVTSLQVSQITTQDVTTSTGQKVIVTYTIPSTLYDSVVAQDDDQIVSQ